MCLCYNDGEEEEGEHLLQPWRILRVDLSNCSSSNNGAFPLSSASDWMKTEEHLITGHRCLWTSLDFLRSYNYHGCRVYEKVWSRVSLVMVRALLLSAFEVTLMQTKQNVYSLCVVKISPCLSILWHYKSMPQNRIISIKSFIKKHCLFILLWEEIFGQVAFVNVRAARFVHSLARNGTAKQIDVHGTASE